MIGDVVKLVNTSMKMTVENISTDGKYIKVCWFDRDNNLNRYVFPANQIMES